MKKGFVKGAAVMMAAMTMLTGCNSKPTDSTATTGTSAADTSAADTTAATDATTTEGASNEVKQSFDKLTLEFVPSKDADVIITGTKELPQLVKEEMAKLGYDIGEVDISVGTSYDATGEAMSAGTIDVGWLPGGTYATYSNCVVG